MPLIKSPSKSAMSTNISEMVHAGHPQRQAIAAAYSNARKYGAKFQFGGTAGMPFSVGTGSAASAMPMRSTAPQATGVGAQLNPQILAMLARARSGLGGMQSGGAIPRQLSPALLGYLHRQRMQGVPRMQAGGLPTMPWFARSEARNLTHGMLKSPVPGRTDKLPISVQGGAYVVPSDHVAHLGQSNSLAGADVLSKMFNMTPAGQAPLKSTKFRMPSLPRVRLPTSGGNLSSKTTSLSARGGSKTPGAPVDIVAAGGEFVIPPEKIIEKFGSLERGHRILDKWIMETRKKHVKTLKSLKPPKRG